jgi:hypothetical protein
MMNTVILDVQALWRAATQREKREFENSDLPKHERFGFLLADLEPRDMGERLLEKGSIKFE